MHVRLLLPATMFLLVSHCKFVPGGAERQNDSEAKAIGSQLASPEVKGNFVKDFEDRKKNVVPFNPEVIRKIIHPNLAAKERYIQDPAIASASVENALENLRDNHGNGDLAYKVEMAYGLNEYTNSYSEKDDGSYGSIAASKGDDSHKFNLGTSLNCFTCHSGRVGEQFVPGRGNPRVDLGRFFGDVFVGVNIDMFREMMQTYSRVTPRLLDDNAETFSIFTDLPLMKDMYDFISNTENQTKTAGTSDPWVFAVQLFKWRNDDMSYLKGYSDGRGFKLQPVTLDPMPWWNLRYKDYINYDAIISKSPRTVVQASFSPGKSGADIRAMDPFLSAFTISFPPFQPA